MELDHVRSLLFVPGHRPDRFAEALASGADQVIVDLEDAVAPPDKTAARAEVDAWLGSGAAAVVRINAPGTPWFEADVAMARRHGCPVVVPKAADAAVLAGLELVSIALVETAEGILDARLLARAPGVVRLAFGSVDLAAELGVDPEDHRALDAARFALVLASAAAGIAPPIDGVTTAIGRHDLLAADLAHARRLGFGAKLCVHPGQVTAVNESFLPDAEELIWAGKVTAADRGEAVVVDGRMVDRPVVERARHVLARAERYQVGGTCNALIAQLETLE